MKKNESDREPSATQLAAFRALWVLLLAPREPTDESLKKEQKPETDERDDQTQPQN